MNQGLQRVLIVLAVSLLAGLLSGYLFFCLFVGLLVYLYLEYRTLADLLRWMRSKRYTDAPVDSGVPGAIAALYEDLRSHHRKQKHRLASYLRRFKEAAQALPDAVVVLGRNDEIEWANSKAGIYLGIRHPQDRGQRLINLYRNPALLAFMRERRGGRAQAAEKSLELVSPADPDMHLELRLISYGDTGTLLVARDITKIYRINRMRTDFIANASHELRTPLTVIAGYLESFEDDLADDDEAAPARGRVRQMRRQAERMRRLIEDLLKLSMLETTESHSHHEPVRVPDLLSGIVEEAKALSGE